MESKDAVYEARRAKLLEFLADAAYPPLAPGEIAALMGVPAGERGLFDRLAEDIVSGGAAVLTKRGKLATPERLGLIAGTFRRQAAGYGFVTPAPGVAEAAGKSGGDIFIPAASANAANDKDTVLCRITGPRGGARKPENAGGECAEGEIVKVLKRGVTSFVGLYRPVKNGGFLVLDNKRLGPDIFIPKGLAGGAVEGSKAVARITRPPDSGLAPEGRIVEILGHRDDPGVDVMSAVRQSGVSAVFNKRVERELLAVPEAVSPDDIGAAGERLDLRGLLTVTIDGEDTKDIDDAVSLEELPGGRYRLGVHIADVAHYVKEGSALDMEALNRGTSIYLADRVIPMLPHKLSNGICSLNERADRFALSCLMEFDAAAGLISHEIRETVVNVDRRLTYGAANAVITGADRDRSGRVTSMLRKMAGLSAALREKRVRRGAVEFGFKEARIIVDADGRAVGIALRERNAATGLIEEFMLACNETVAEEYYWLGLPFVYRTHEEPDPDKMEALARFVRNFGYKLGRNVKYSGAIQKLLNSAKDSPEEAVIGQAALRSLKQARYTPDNLGHFGLAAKYYCHFTSPIRRYPDLQIHRIIKENIGGQLAGNRDRVTALAAALPAVCARCSAAERAAEALERDVENMKKAEYMSAYIGRRFEGVISGVTPWGLYVTLPNTVEGLVSYENMRDDYYVFDRENMMCAGERHKKVYKTGGRLAVALLSADPGQRRIDFEIIK